MRFVLSWFGWRARLVVLGTTGLTVSGCGAAAADASLREHGLDGSRPGVLQDAAYDSRPAVEGTDDGARDASVWGEPLEHDASRPAPAARVRLMIVGDSITQGSAGDFTWRYRLDRHLTRTGTAFDFVGTRDDLFDNVADRQGSQDYADPGFDRDHDSVWGGSLVEAKTHIQGDVLQTGAEILLVQLGINDLVFFGTVEQAEQNLRSLITNARAANPTLRFVFGRVLPKRHSDAASVSETAEFNRRLGATVTELTSAGSPMVIATPDVDFDSTTQSYDGVHPNAVGEVHIAAAFADALHAAFGVGTPYPRPLPAVPLGPQVPPVLTVLGMDAAATLSWTPSPGATGYYIWLRDLDLADTATRLPYAVQSPWTANQLRSGATYEFQVQPAKWEATGVLSTAVAVTAR